MIVYIYGLWDSRTYELKYIGRTNNLYMRFAAHISEAITRKGYNPRKDKWIRDLLREDLAPELEILEECTEDTHEEIEKTWIAEAKEKGAILLNLSDGGNGWLYGESHPMYGKFGENHHSFGRKHSEESKRKMSESQKRRAMLNPASEETRKRISKFFKGRKHSDEDRRKMSEGRTGIKVIPFTEEHKRRISEALTGKKYPKHSKETKLKRALAIRMTNAHKKDNIIWLRYLQAEYFSHFGYYNKKYDHYFC